MWTRSIAALFIASLLASSVAGCAHVDVTKTAQGFHEPTRADDVEILMTKPDRKFIELGTISTSRWNARETAKMHNALRSKSAPLGANAVVLLNSGIDADGYLWSTGVAIRYQ